MLIIYISVLMLLVLQQISYELVDETFLCVCVYRRGRSIYFSKSDSGIREVIKCRSPTSHQNRSPLDVSAESTPEQGSDLFQDCAWKATLSSGVSFLFPD